MSKRLMYSMPLVLVLGVVFTSLANAADPNLVGWWKLDDGSGTTAADSSGNGHDGTLNGNPTWVAGLHEGALEFGGQPDYVSVPYSAELHPEDGFTLDLWANVAPGSSGWRSPITSRDDPPPSGYIIYAGSDGNWQFWIGTGSTWSSAAGPAVQPGEWTHVAAVYASGQQTLYINGQPTGQASATISPNTAQVLLIGAGASEDPSHTYFFEGVIDDVRIYDGPMTDTQIEKLAIRPKAHNPSPPDGAEGVVSPLFQWTAGTTAKWHDIYFGTNPTPGAAEYKGQQPLAWNMYYHLEPLIPGATYYWRIDQVEADGTTIHTGDVWSFTVAPLTAYNPDPPDGAKYVDPDTDLNWTAGTTAASHDVYLGTDEAAVTDGTGGTFKGNQPDPPHDAGTLAKDTRYYWRIDEVEQDNTTKHTGDVWSFKTLPDIPITDPDLVGWWKLDEGEGTTALDWSGHGNHGTLVGDPQWVPGYDGGALELDGGNWVDLGNSSDLTITEALTIACWVNPAGLGGQRAFVARDGAYVLKSSGDNLRFTTPGILDHDGLNTILQTGIWQHVAATFQPGQPGGLVFYLNGVETDRVDASALNAGSGPVRIGTNQWSETYTGLIDDARIYKKILTQEEIKQAMRGDPRLAWNPNPANGSIPDIEHATPLSWSPGENAAKHDVYFGTDRDAVEDADMTTTGIYRGRQDPNTYTPAEGVQFGQRYYWRIDEYNSTTKTISKGRVWSFTVADYLSVDDFDSYDDYCNRIFYTWPDGWGHNGDAACGVPPYGGNGTGSTVGYLSEPYAEQTITHAGSFQSMPMEYLNDGSSGKALYSETERTFDPPQDWTRHDVKALTLWFRGYPGTMSSFAGSDPYTMTAAGGDIWGTADHFHFVWKRFSGEGSIVARVDSLEGENPHVWAKAGVMIRETLDANSVQAMVIVTPSTSNRVQFARRLATGGTSDSTHTDVDAITLPHWVKLTRQANMFTAQHSTDGVNWENVGDPTSVDIVMGPDVFVGLALTSQQDAARIPITAVFSNITIAGSVSGQWTSQDIGLTYNAAEPLYVAVEDSTGTSKVVNHTDDPNAVLSNTWQEWNIDLKQVADAGVNLQSVKKMYIGAGNRAAPQLGGGGMLYIDDIRLYAPRCMPSRAKSAADFNSNCVIDYPDLKILTNDWLFAPGASGLNYEYYQSDWDLLPGFDSLTPTLVGKVDNFDISVRTQDDYFGFRFTGQIHIAAAGDYTFYTESDDGSQLYIDDTLVVDNDGLHGMVEQSGTINLTAGMHPITVTMFEKGGGEGLNVQYEGPGITKEPIPDDVLYRQSSLVDLSGDGTVDFMDYALLADVFLDEKLWP